MSNKLKKLREQMNKMNIQGFFVPHGDKFRNEYLPKNAERLAFISGFTGSAGNAVILEDKAAFFTDGRYTIVSKQEVSATDFEICSISADQGDTPTITPLEWIEKNIPTGARMGYDPWLHTSAEAKTLEQAVRKSGGTLVPCDSNPLDAIWDNRPDAPMEPVIEHPLKYAGETSEDKRKSLAKTLQNKQCQAIVLNYPEDIAWLLNIRGNDVPCTPLPLSFAIAHDNGKIDLFIDSKKTSTELKNHLGKGVTIHEFNDFEQVLESLARTSDQIWVDPNQSPVKVEHILLDSGVNIHNQQNPCLLAKACKNDTEIKGTINAHIRDGVALTRYLFALSKKEITAKHTELSGASLLDSFRAQNDKFKGLSFETISGAGSNGAIVHYRVTPETDKPLMDGPIYLVDSGGQYLDGTTDVTRTIAVDPDNITDEMKEHFTRVLKGHIQVATSVFPKGETGNKLDEKARSALKGINLDYAHGTGHGVGSHLSVHEGPQGIHPRADKTPLEAGMIISNEPGYYKDGAYGIRIENLLVVEEAGIDSDGNELLKFRNLTMAPIDINLIKPELLTNKEMEYLNKYHKDVSDVISPLLEKVDKEASIWLKKVTAPLQKKL